MPGERSYVTGVPKEVHLFPFTSTRAVAHEFGHVLGFKDHYYTMWNSDQCIYKVETNSGDLMSDSSSGSVTATEWSDIKKNYIK